MSNCEADEKRVANRSETAAIPTESLRYEVRSPIMELSPKPVFRSSRLRGPLRRPPVRRSYCGALGLALQRLAAGEAGAVAEDAHRVPHQEALQRRQAVDNAPSPTSRARRTGAIVFENRRLSPSVTAASTSASERRQRS